MPRSTCPRQEHQGLARRIWPRRIFGWPHACQIRLHLCDRAWRGDPQQGQRRTGDDLQGRTEFLRTGDRHAVSANASEMEPAKLLAVFVVDSSETPLTIPFGNW